MVADQVSLVGMALDRTGDFSRSALLVRHAEQADRRPVDGETEREESGRTVEELNLRPSTIASLAAVASPD